MKIDESIRELEKARDSIEPYLFLDEAIDQSMKTAITIMHKYQKIEEIYKNWSHGADSCDCMKDIERVVEDGNDD